MKKYLSLGKSFLMAWAFVGTTTLNAQVPITHKGRLDRFWHSKFRHNYQYGL